MFPTCGFRGSGSQRGHASPPGDTTRIPIDFKQCLPPSNSGFLVSRKESAFCLRNWALGGGYLLLWLLLSNGEPR